MIANDTTFTDEKLKTVLKRFLSTASSTIPADVFEAISYICSKDNKENKLPSTVFLETVEQAPVAISITDPQAKILYVNATFEKLTGYSREEVIGKNESLLSSKSTPTSVYKKLWETINLKEIWNGILINHRKDDQEYIAELSISPVLNTENQIAYYLGMHRDISEIHQLEQRLKFQQSLTETAMNAAPMIVVMLAADGKLLMENTAYKSLLRDFNDISPVPLFVQALEQQLGYQLYHATEQKVAKNRAFNNIEISINVPGSTSSRWFSCSGTHILKLDESANNYFNKTTIEHDVLLLMANEITSHRKRINDARLNMIRATMTEQQMIESMREAISASIYKFQAPLNMVKAAVNMLGANPEQLHLKSTLQQALITSDEAMQSLHLALPKAIEEQTSRVNLNEILHEVIKLSTKKLLTASIIVDWRPASILPMIPGRENALRVLFKYLIDNAIQATSEATHNDKEIRIQTKLDQADVLIEVIDNGIGLAEDIRLKVFEPFFCAWKQAGEHAGMGLTMAQEILIHHNGSIEIDPQFFGGCRMFIRLPLDEKFGESHDD